MPAKRTIERTRKDAQEGKAPSTQAGEFVREEIQHVREGKHGARSNKQRHRDWTFEGSAIWSKTAPARKPHQIEKTLSCGAASHGCRFRTPVHHGRMPQTRSARFQLFPRDWKKTAVGSGVPLPL